jgi:hypothetical protein
VSRAVSLNLELGLALMRKGGGSPRFTEKVACPFFPPLACRLRTSLNRKVRQGRKGRIGERQTARPSPQRRTAFNAAQRAPFLHGEDAENAEGGETIAARRAPMKKQGDFGFRIAE